MADGVDLAWMAWTLPTALFFVGIVASLVAMGVWERLVPTVRRRGFLPMETTRGDRFFVGLLSSAFVHLAWLALVPAPAWVASLLCLVWLGVLLRWG
jgi:predicted small integral membrane protein